MPTTRDLSWSMEGLEGSVDAYIDLVDEEEVYFTDQEPRFEITIENNTEYDFIESSHIAWVIAIGQGRPEPFIREQKSNVDIPPGGTEEIEISGEPLSLEGHGIVAIGGGSFPHINHQNKDLRFTATSTGKEDYEPLATFSVWDRQHYEIIHEQPQRAQQFSLFASVGIVFFAIIQSGTILGYPLLGLAVGIVLLIIYWYSGFLDDLIGALRSEERGSQDL